MAMFTDLPNELIIDIWGGVIDPEDVESFALVSKKVYDLAAPFLKEHTCLKQQYSRVCYPNGQTGEVVYLLEKMLLNPRITLYINELQIDGWAGSWAEQQAPLHVRSYSKATMNLLKDEIRHSSFDPPSDVKG